MYKPKQTESKLLIYQKYIDLIEYGYRLLIKYFLEFSKKIIFYDTEKVGIPIGNYTSQYYANIYMTKLDKYIKENLKICYYTRYMDDFVLILESKEKAKEMLEKIKVFFE